MPVWAVILIQVLATAFTVALVQAGFWGLVVRPYLDRKVAELIQASQEIEPNVTRGVKRGVEETIKGFPESALDGTVKESTRQFLKFGSGLFENGLSSFLGSAADLERKAEAERRGQRPAD
ncbi:hypothetical protein QQF73_09190 [Marinobacter sp. M216]|uniref:DUF948 domain-containing protein n=1 Tax=Marinobacter albus TaxID=3030833 RepID=A0ABT7HE15_9GAMM|nr:MULTISPECIES: hypothetical protein [unclassified Marinobacter]MBW7469944.1 hypothetical protein [Marinobacter sp. F4218]MDK9557796.1 hypothetical protein [Marinobacter sp. M216]